MHVNSGLQRIMGEDLSNKLYHAVNRGDLEKLRTHIDNGGDINWRNPEEVGPNLTLYYYV